MSPVDKLVHMANQIAQNFMAEGEAAAIAATADHIELFWAPRMKLRILESRAGLSPAAAAAVQRLRDVDVAR